MLKKQKHILFMFQNNSKSEKQVILLMILNRQKCQAKSKGKQQWHYLAVKKLSTLLRGTKSKINGDFYCLNYLQSFRTRNKYESHKKVCENKDFYKVVMPSEETKILEFN